jgi:hypothetical protein
MKNTQKIILSFVFVIAISFVTHYFFVERIETKDRELASFAERSSVPQIKWEQKIAEELSSSATTQGAVKPSWQDLMVYEYLAGQYDVVVKQGHIEKMQLQPSMSGVKFQTQEFIEKYVRKMKTFSRYQTEFQNSNSEVIEFFDQQGASAGRLKIDRDDKGLVQVISLQ